MSVLDKYTQSRYLIGWSLLALGVVCVIVKGWLMFDRDCTDQRALRDRNAGETQRSPYMCSC